MSTAANLRFNDSARTDRPKRSPLTALVAAVASVTLALTGITLTSVAANAAPGDITGGSVTWGMSTELRSASMGRPNPLPAEYVAPAVFDSVTRLSSWANGSGTVNLDGSASLAFEGKTVNHAPTGGGWLTMSDPEIVIDSDGNGHLSAVISYGTAPGAYPPAIPFDPAQTPDRGPERVKVVALTGNAITVVKTDDSVTWPDLAGAWHSDFLAYLAGDVTADPAIPAWSYASWVTNTGAETRKVLPMTIALDLESAPEPDPIVYDEGTAVWGLSTYLNSATGGRPNPSASNYVAPASFDAVSRLSSWGGGSGTLESDGSASLAFEGTSVNHATTGGGWLKLADLEVELDADGNGTVSAIVSYGTAVPPANFDPAQVPARGPERVTVVALQGNDAAPVVTADSASWSGLAGVWHADFLAFLAGDSGAAPAIPGWAYASTVTNDPAATPGPRTVLPFDFELGITPPPVAVTPTVALVATPSSGATQGTSVALAATVAPAAAGTIEFRNGATVLGTATVSSTSGTAALAVSTLPVGSHSLTAVYSPTDTVAYTSATSPTVSFEVFAKAAVSPGYLSWGVKSSFRTYITTIAHGTITVGSGAGAVGGVYRFPQSAGGSFDATTGLGSANYRGSVAFSGHSGALSMSLSSPTVRVTSASAGVLSVVAAGLGRIDIATLNLAAAGRSVDATGAVTYSNAPATLTAAGATAFSNYYSAGEALDPVSFVLGSASSSSFASSTTGTTPKEEFVPPAIAPASTGLEFEGDGDGVFGNDEITVTGEGFEPNEPNIHVVVYSEPIVLATDVKADANGVATWTGRLPVGLTGEHILTLQGSVSRGLVLNIKTVAQLEGCTVAEAILSWGFKETFRAYIDGSIAHGEWAVSNGATYETPNFGWSNGVGVYDTDSRAGLVTFAGEIRFTGHDGLLDTRFANPQLQFVDATTAYILLDVSSLPMDDALAGGTDRVESTAVPFVKLTLTDAVALSADGLVLTGTDVPAALTPEGNAVFSNYDAGTAFDAVTFSISLGGDCAEAAPVAEEPEEPATEAEAADLTWLYWVGGGALAAGVLGGLVLLLRRRQL